MGRGILKMVILECRAGPAILFADLCVPYCIIHCFDVGFHDEILHRGITYTYASRYLWCGTYGKTDFRDFPKKQYPAYGHTITGNFFEKFFNFQKFFLGFD